jgi:cytosine/uracil/thiamine/allantoin permease
MTQDTSSGQGKPLGPVAAVFVAAGIGSVVLGLLTTLAEASKGISDFLQLNARVGPLSGKTIFATVAFLVLWGIFHVMWKDKEFEAKKIFTWTAVMVAIAVLLTFPIFFQLFAAD